MKTDFYIVIGFNAAEDDIRDKCDLLVESSQGTTK